MKKKCRKENNVDKKYRLEPCPFCGSTNVFFLPAENVLGFEWPSIVCEACFAAVRASPDEETLVEIWNNRPINKK